MPKGSDKTPLPGQPVRSSNTGRPIMAALDLLGRRWSLRIIWELRDGPVGFRELQSRCENMSPSVLSKRLHELNTARIIAPGANRRWSLTPDGKNLVRAIAPLNKWAENWRILLQPDEPPEN